MTLKEIEKIIDEADMIKKYKANMIEKYKITQKGIGLEVYSGENRTQIKNYFKDGKSFTRGNEVWFFYKFSEYTGKFYLIAKVDHIDEEKKEKKENKSKYKKGEQIKTIEEFDEVIKNNGVLFLHNVAKHTSFLQNLQYHYIKLEIDRGNMYKAIKKTEDDNKKEVN